MSEKRKGLGRGLSSLLGEDAAPSVAATRTLPVEFLQPGKYQPRRHFDDEAMQALVSSIRQQGVVQPLLVREIGSGRYEIIAGERRWRAAQQAQLHDVPVVVRDMSDREALEIALVENIQRQDLSPLEEAEAYKRLMEEFQHTQEALAQSVGKSRSHIANMLRLLALPASVHMLIESGALSAGHARALVNAPDPAALAHEVVAKGLSVRETERLAQRAKGKDGAAATRGARPGGLGNRAGAPVLAKDADTAALERDLTMLLGLKVSISFAGRGGALTIQYDTLEQLDDVIQRLNGA